MTMEPEFMNNGDPAHGVGVIEWKVYGKYAEDKPETVDKTALDAVIREAESRAEKDYTSDSWETFARVLESAKAVQKNESATQEEVDNATALLTEAMDNLEPVKEEPVKEADKKELKKAIANAEKYTRVDYTEESWNDFQTALQAAYLVDNNTAATQKEVDGMHYLGTSDSNDLEAGRSEVSVHEHRNCRIIDWACTSGSAERSSRSCK